MHSTVKKISLLTTMLALTGCSTWESRPHQPIQTTAYAQARSIAPVKAPANLSSENLVNRYPITPTPVTNQEVLAPAPSIVPPASSLPPATSAVQTVMPAATPTHVAVNTTTQPNVVPAPQLQQPQSTTASISAPVVTPANGPVIVSINYDYSKAWDKVGQALRASGYRVLQQDSSLGRYYVLDLAGTNGQLRRNTPIYQVHLIETGNGKTQLTLLDSHNKPADGTIARRILGAVQQKLAS